MFYFGLQILLLLLVLIAVGLLVKNRILRLCVFSIGSLFVTLQMVSLAFNGDLINYRFYEQINFGNIWMVKGFFWVYIIVFLLLFVALLFLLRYTVRKLAKKKIKPLLPIGVLFVAGVFLFLPDGIGDNLYEIAKIKTAKTRSFHVALKQLGIDPEEYVSHEEIEAKPGKNIIVLSLESLERGYLEPPLKELTPNLRSLAKRYAYIEMEEQLGANWTAASAYTTITGVPAYFRETRAKGNSIFQGTSFSKIGSLGSVLQTAGYDMSYLISKKDFAGMGDMLKTFGFEVKSDGDFGKNYKATHWGIHDKDMFAELKKEILAKKEGNKPFAVFLSTISGHFPHGIYDERMESVLPPRDSHLEFMASAVDRYIGDLFGFLKENNLLKTTEVFIFPDHKLMGSTSEVLKKFGDERGLYLISTADKEKMLEGIQQPVLQMDLPRMIVNGAGIKTNATFLSSFIESDKQEYLEKNRGDMLALNEASLERNSYEKGFRLAIAEQQNGLVLSSLKGSFKEIISAPPDNMFGVILFTNDLRFLSQREIPHKDTEFPPLKSGYYSQEIINAFDTSTKHALIYSIIGDTIYAFLRNGPHLGTMRKGKIEVVFEKNDIAALSGWPTIKPGPVIKANEIFLKSTGYESILGYGASRIYVGYKPMPVKRGINLLYFDNGAYKTYNTDTFANKEKTKELLEVLRKLIDSQKLIAIVVHDSSVEKLGDFANELEKIGLPELAQLEYRQPYIAVFHEDGIIEKTGHTLIKTSIPLKTPLASNRALAQDTIRFIAHAGGGINGDTYTNSLEALNLNYKKGFRLFELDIIKTSDNVFVAAHDWTHWSKVAGYDGKIPVSLEVFLENPIEDYTPLSIKDINRWFKQHPDAILVTDKVNDPSAFSQAFIDKKRLMMELFSLEAAKEARELGIEVLLSDNVIEQLENNVLKTLREMDIHYIAISRRLIKDYVELLEKLKTAGIKTYVFHLYNEFDEDYVLKYEMDYIYGMYADEWDFRNSEKKQLKRPGRTEAY